MFKTKYSMSQVIFSGLQTSGDELTSIMNN